MMEPESSKQTQPLAKAEVFNCLDELRQLELLKIVLSQGIRLRMTAYGASMFPFIRDGDVVTISPLTDPILHVGEIVAFERPETQQLVIHRVIRSTLRGYVIKGDRTSASDGEIPLQNILGKITKIERKDKNANFGISKAGKWIALLSRGLILQKLRLFFPLLDWF